QVVGLVSDNGGDAKAQVLGAERWNTIVSERRPATPGGNAPTPSPVHPKRPIAGALRIVRARLRIVVLPVPVRTPLPNVSMHIAQSPWVWRFLSNMVRPSVRICAEPRHVREACFVIPRTPPCRRTSTARVFPLRLGWKGVLPLGCLFVRQL